MKIGCNPDLDTHFVSPNAQMRIKYVIFVCIFFPRLNLNVASCSVVVMQLLVSDLKRFHATNHVGYDVFFPSSVVIVGWQTQPTPLRMRDSHHVGTHTVYWQTRCVWEAATEQMTSESKIIKTHEFSWKFDPISKSMAFERGYHRKATNLQGGGRGGVKLKYFDLKKLFRFSFVAHDEKCELIFPNTRVCRQLL